MRKQTYWKAIKVPSLYRKLFNNVTPFKHTWSICIYTVQWRKSWNSTASYCLPSEWLSSIYITLKSHIGAQFKSNPCGITTVVIQTSLKKYFLCYMCCKYEQDNREHMQKTRTHCKMLLMLPQKVKEFTVWL